MKTRIPALLCVVSMIAVGASAQELVRVRISDMDGSEPGTISSVSHPALFDLGPQIASAELTFLNPAAPSKNNIGPAIWMPALTPFSVSDPDPAGRIDLTITPVGGEMVSYGGVTYTTGARYANNPSSLRLQSSADGFAATLSVIATNMQQTETTALPTTPTDVPFVIRWEAHDDFGAFGGGEAGFAAGDVVVSAPAATGQAIPTLGTLGLLLFAALLVGTAFVLLGRS